MTTDIKQLLERATPRPWSVYKESQFIISNDGEDLATAENMYIGGVDTARANAELIVTAVNSFESNRELIRELAAVLSGYVAVCGNTAGAPMGRQTAKEFHNAAQAVLTKAREAGVL